jgi:putative CocE/NonD family hydrolase
VVRRVEPGPQTWLDFEAWPPTAEVQTWHLGVGESLVRTYSAPPTATSSFVFDPTGPTPAVGGRLFMGAGRFDNAGLESCDDVLIFTSGPLDTDVDVIGSPAVNIAVSVGNRSSDIFVRLTDVDIKGTSTNVSDTIHRLDSTIPPNQIQRLTLTMDPCGYRFNAGHCVRLQVSGAPIRGLPQSGGRRAPVCEHDDSCLSPHRPLGGLQSEPPHHPEGEGKGKHSTTRWVKRTRESRDSGHANRHEVSPLDLARAATAPTS